MPDDIYKIISTYSSFFSEAMVVYPNVLEPGLVFFMVEHEQLEHINGLHFHLHLQDYYTYTYAHIHVYVWK